MSLKLNSSGGGSVTLQEPTTTFDRTLTLPDSSGSFVAANSSGDVGIGTTSPGSKLDVKGTIRLSGSSSGYVGLAPPAAAGSTTYTLPSADGTSNQVLTTNGSGALSWATAGGGFSNLKTFIYQTGTYTRSGTLVTCTVTDHGLTTGDSIVIDFITGGALDGTYTVTVTASNTFTVTTAASGTITTSNMAITGYNWVIPTGVTKAKVTVVGGGGGSGVAQAAGCPASYGSSGGGGGGGAAIEIVSGLTPGNTVTVSIGAGGTAGTGTGAGGSGGTSSFGAFCSATGGAGSNGATGVAGSGGSGGLGSGGNLNIQGTGGGAGSASNGSAAPTNSGAGGSSILGGGAIGRGQGGVGNAGNAYGGGAGGATSTNNGAAGAAGVVVVEW